MGIGDIRNLLACADGACGIDSGQLDIDQPTQNLSPSEGRTLAAALVAATDTTGRDTTTNGYRSHPEWCVHADSSGPNICGGQHISDTADVPALGGPWTLTDSGGEAARAEVYLTHDADEGRTTVGLGIFDSNVSDRQRGWISAALDPTGAERLAVALMSYAHQARRPITWKPHEEGIEADA